GHLQRAVLALCRPEQLRVDARPRQRRAGRQQRRPRRRADPVAPARRAVGGAEDVRDLATRTEHHLPVLRPANAQPPCRARRPCATSAITVAAAPIATAVPRTTHTVRNRFFILVSFVASRRDAADRERPC